MQPTTSARPVDERDGVEEVLHLTRAGFEGFRAQPAAVLVDVIPLLVEHELHRPRERVPLVRGLFGLLRDRRR